MDPILQGKKLEDEITAVKRHLQALENQHLKLSNDFASPLNQRPRRVNLPQVCALFTCFIKTISALAVPLCAQTDPQAMIQ